jgi:CDP-diacylglycerol--glycerol-3-phosphate 3-phosphatidyltransferase
VSGSFVSPETRQRIKHFGEPIALGLGRLGLTPNALTLIGFIGTCVAALAAAIQLWLLAGVLVLAFGIFDMFDGTLARATGRASKFGAFLDSTLDRTGENLVYAGIAVGSFASGFGLGVGLAGLAMAFASVVTYGRAKAEVIGLHGEVGIAPREIRLVILSIGLAAAGISAIGDTSFPDTNVIVVGDWFALYLDRGDGYLSLALGLIAMLSAVTVVQRIVHVKSQLDRQELATKEQQ